MVREKRLILDHGEVNLNIWKEKIQFEDWDLALQIFRKNGFCINDMKSGYNHIDICTEQTFLGFKSPSPIVTTRKSRIPLEEIAFLPQKLEIVVRCHQSWCLKMV